MNCCNSSEITEYAVMTRIYVQFLSSELQLTKDLISQWGHHKEGKKAIATMVIRSLDERTRSICICSFGPLTKAVRLFMASLHSQPMCCPMCSIGIFVYLTLSYVRPPAAIGSGTWGRGWAHSIARPGVPNSSPLTHMSQLFIPLFWSYFRCLQKRFRPPARATKIRWQ